MPQLLYFTKQFSIFEIRPQSNNKGHIPFLEGEFVKMRGLWPESLLILFLPVCGIVREKKALIFEKKKIF
jgi:hypothetical protein